MLPRRVRRASVPLLLLLLLLASGCGRPAGDDRVVAGSTGAPAQAVTTTSTAAAAPDPGASTTIVAASPAGTDPSPVTGLTAGQLAEAVAAVPSASVRALGGPTLDRVAVGATTVWRVRVPSDVPVRAARVEVLVGERVVGQGVPSADLSTLVAVTTDPSGLVAGAPVRLRWEGADAVAAGRLAVAR